MIGMGVLAIVAVAAGQPQDPRWAPFEGCWVPQVSEGAVTPPVMLCVRQNADGVVFASYTDGRVSSERQLRADGVTRTVEEGGCTGAEVGTWSGDARRVFVQSDLSCAGATRASRTVLAFVSEHAFVDVQSVQVGKETAVRTIRYRAVQPSLYPEGFELDDADNLMRQTARLQAAASLDAEDVIEASRSLHAEAVNALIAARNAAFELNAQQLQRLAAAGVAPSTLDVMVAVTYPKRFAVAEQRAPAEEMAPWRPRRSALDDPDLWRDRWSGYGSSWYGSYGIRSMYGSRSCYGLGYYSSFECDMYWGRYGFNYGSGIIVVQPVTPGQPGSPVRSGSVSAGGYSRGTGTPKGTAAPRAPSFDGGARSSVGSAGASGSGSSSGSGSGVGSGSSSGSVSEGGHSAGSGSKSTGQTAKPREGGE